MVRDAVVCHFEEASRPKIIRSSGSIGPRGHVRRERPVAPRNCHGRRARAGTGEAAEERYGSA